jgi:pSer/pThr/pTyr-binding forkhead associated (FHA) protein
MMGIRLIMQSADGVERSFPLRKPRTVIGREVLCDVRVPVPAVSERHCELVLDGDRLHLQDLDSDRGTLHNGQPVRSAELADEDRVTIGPVTFVVRISQELDIRAGSPDVTITRDDDGSAPGLDHPSDD